MNNNRQKVVVIKTEGKYMRVATEDRRFLTLLVPEEGVSAGQELWLDVDSEKDLTKRSEKRSWLSGLSPVVKGGRAAAAAAVLLVLITGVLYATLMPSREVATYLALDINPSLELALDSNNRVIEIIPHNEEAESLVENVSPGEKDALEVLDAVIREAKQKGYVYRDGDNLFLVTLVNAGEAGSKDENGDYESSDDKIISTQLALEKIDGLNSNVIKETIKRSIIDMDLAGNVGVQYASIEEREQAKKEDKSLNNYVLTKKASREAEVDEKEFENLDNRDVINELDKRDLPPGRVFDEAEWVPPGLEKKQEDVSGEKEVPGEGSPGTGPGEVPPGLEDREDMPPGQRDESEKPGEGPEEGPGNIPGNVPGKGPPDNIPGNGNVPGKGPPDNIPGEGPGEAPGKSPGKAPGKRP